MILDRRARLARAMAVGVPVEYLRVLGAGHGAAAARALHARGRCLGQTAFDRMLRFAERRLFGRRGRGRS